MNEITVNFEKQTVSARELHKQLEISKRFSTWFETNSQGFVENEDFTGVLSGTVVNNGAIRELQDYEMSVDMAKHICLMSRTEKGKQVRQYLIDLEKSWNTPEQVMARALKMADVTINNLKERNHQLLEDNKRMQPKVALAEAMLTSKNAISVGDFAKSTYSKFGLGTVNMFRVLRDTGFLLENNTPYQKYINAGYFRVIEVPVTIGYQKYLMPKTLITPKGQEYLFKKLSEVLLRY